jgi:cystathionine gamma-synthase
MTATDHDSARPLGPATLAVHGGYTPGKGDGLSPAIDLSSTFRFAGHPGNPDEAVPFSYGRAGNPGFLPLERTVADLERAKHGIVLNAGMAAAIPLMLEAKPGTAIVMPYDCYYGIRAHAERIMPERNVEVRLVDQTDLGAVERALDGASLMWTESPTNPLMAVADFAAIDALCRARNVPWVIDNTFASPILQNPLEWGALAIMHSLTKYIGGHSDLLLGAVVTNDDALNERVRFYRDKNGTQPDGFTSWLARRGAQTVALRVRHASASALEIATRLERHPAIEKVYYPGLPSHPGHELAKTQMRGGFGGMLSILVRGGGPAAQAVVDNVRVWVPATSLGSVESLIERRARWTGEVAPENLLRLSTGIEELEDLWADLEQALDAAARRG